MPLYKKIKIKNGDFILIWRISESKQELLNNIKQNSLYKSKLSSITSETKQIEFLSVLNLLENLGFLYSDIQYDTNGKPHLSEGYISISHSFEFSTVVISKNKVGIDIEKFREKILKIYKKFISEKEYEIFNKECIESLTKAWSIKESVYKAFGHNGIDFKKNIKIQSLKKNKAFVLINKYKKIEKYNVDLFKISNYICSLAQLKK